MASEQDDAVFDHDHDLEDDDDESFQSQDDDDDLENDNDVIIGDNENENDDVLPDDEDEEEEEDVNSVSPSTSSPPPVIPPVPVALPSASLVTIAAVPNGGGSVAVDHGPSLSLASTPPDLKRQRVETTLVVHEKKPLPPPMDDSSRRLFQRLWTDEDEIELLQGFFDYTMQRGSNHHDTAMFYDQIKSKLQLDFNKNQLVEKLRRLKKKYRNVLNKISSGKDFSFKNPHDQATFEISRKIWSSTGKICVDDGNLDDEDGGNPNPNPNLNFNSNFNHHHHAAAGDVKIEDHHNKSSTPRSKKRSRPRSTVATSVKFEDKRMPIDGFVPIIDVNNNNNNNNVNVNVSNLIEETVRSCLSPLLKELLSNAMASGSASGSVCSGRGIGGLAMNAMPLSFGSGEMMVDEKWRKQQMLELEVYSKRLELVQDQIRAQLEDLRSMGGLGQ